jgi:hypothetical protein
LQTSTCPRELAVSAAWHPRKYAMGKLKHTQKVYNSSASWMVRGFQRGLLLSAVPPKQEGTNINNACNIKSSNNQ